MIRVGIVGADTVTAGELIRILVHHPEVEFLQAFAPALRGRALSSYHIGIIGDTDLKFTDILDLSELDLVFITGNDSVLNLSSNIPENLKLILIQESDKFSIPPILNSLEFVPGVSEMFRKPLVRGARASRILPPATTTALIILYPLALHLLLNDTVKINIQIPEFKSKELDVASMTAELDDLLKLAQLSFPGINSIVVEKSDTIRAVKVDVEFNCKVSEQEIERIYNEIYDDHNFTFIVRSEPSPAEIAGTHKCLLYISKPSEDKLQISAICDSVLRGGAGDAIHAMNLLFGLFEKTGLSLPAGLAFREEINS